MKEEGHYTIKRVNKLPKKGNANFLYALQSNKIETFYRFLPNGSYEAISVGFPISEEEIAQISINTSNIELKSDKINVIEKDSTTPYTPTLEYHPANKKYVDDNGRGIFLKDFIELGSPSGLVDGDFFVADGYYAKNDGGGGLFRVEDNALIVQDYGVNINLYDNVYAVRVDTSSLNNKHFGVFSDSITVYSNAIGTRLYGLKKAAIKYGVTIESPPGTYFNTGLILDSTDSNSKYHFKDAVFSGLVHAVGESSPITYLTDVQMSGSLTTYDRFGVSEMKNLTGDLNLTLKSDIAIHPSGLKGRGVHIYLNCENINIGNVVIENCGNDSFSNEGAFAIDGIGTTDGLIKGPKNIKVKSVHVKDSEVHGAIINCIDSHIGSIVVDNYGSDAFDNGIAGFGTTSYNAELSKDINMGVIVFGGSTRIDKIVVDQKGGFTGRSKSLIDLCIDGDEYTTAPETRTHIGSCIGDVIIRNPQRQAVAMGYFQRETTASIQSVQIEAIDPNNIIQLNANSERLIYGLIDSYYSITNIGTIKVVDPLNVTIIKQLDVYLNGTERQRVAAKIGVLNTRKINDLGYEAYDLFQGKIDYVLSWNDVNNKSDYIV